MNYLNTHYSEKVRPVTSYPRQLAGFLAERFGFTSGMRMLVFGCGRGELAQQFRDRQIDVVAADVSPDAGKLLQVNDVVLLDAESKPIPFSDNEFDLVFSKSVLEHLPDPYATSKELVRVLKPGGKLVTLTPDWEKNFKIFFDDITHVRPFSRNTLCQLYELLNLEEIDVFRFRQLPSCWKYRSVDRLAAVIGLFVRPRTKVKFLRWSRELMIAGSGRKAISSTKTTR